LSTLPVVVFAIALTSVGLHGDHGGRTATAASTAACTAITTASTTTTAITAATWSSGGRETCPRGSAWGDRHDDAHA
jgi:hypothetical protein